MFGDDFEFSISDQGRDYLEAGRAEEGTNLIVLVSLYNMVWWAYVHVCVGPMLKIW